ncbi:hypothetical protein GOODEAATRI_025937 [Goodea atripinnis]|uniref:Uncharacterized protein n=1 Tax=Goodea atripinnis TaxID=208336 RepID=A0ABV0MKW1_9TELE
MLSSPGAGLQNAISTVGPGQPSATAINSAPTHIDPSSMQRAYAALGLPYGDQGKKGLARTRDSGPAHPPGAQTVSRAYRQKELEEKRRSRLQKQPIMVGAAGPQQPGIAQPNSMGLAQSGRPPS